MGMYTQLFLGVRIKSGAADVHAVLGKMFGKDIGSEFDPPAHPFFKTPRWRQIGRGWSYYFDARSHCDFVAGSGGDGYLTVLGDLKNYDNEIALFLDWLHPFVDEPASCEFKGYVRHESDDAPTLVYYDATGWRFVKAPLPGSGHDTSL